MKKFFAGILGVLLSVALLHPLQAQMQNAQNVRAEILMENTAVRKGESFWLIVRLKMNKGWHTYWKNPGDSGWPTKVSWTLPPGFEAGELLWPYPQKFVTPPLVSYGYHDQVDFLVQIQTPQDFEPNSAAFKAQVRWLECQDVCLPGKQDLSFTVNLNASGSVIDSSLVKEFIAARNKIPDDSRLWQARLETSEKIWKLHLTTDEDNRKRPGKIQLFAEELGVVEPSSPVEVKHDSKEIVLEFAPSAQAQDLQQQTLHFVLTAPSTWDEEGSILAVRVALPYKIVSAAAQKPAASSVGLLLALVLAFGGGMLLNLMPCVLPVLSIKILGFVQSKDDPRAWMQGLFYSGGVLVSFWILAGALLVLRAGGEQLGWGFQLQSPQFVAVLALIFFVLGLNMVGFFEFGSSLTRLDVPKSQSPWAHSFFSGVMATIVATPCTAPFMGSALGYALAQPAKISFLVFTALGLGMALPYAVLSFFPALIQKLPKPGAWMIVLKQAMGLLLLGSVIWLLWVLGRQTGSDGVSMVLLAFWSVTFALWILNQTANAGAIKKTVFRVAALILVVGALFAAQKSLSLFSARPKDGAAQQHLESWQKFSPQTLQELRAQHRAVFIDFSAAWCLTCQVNERLVLGREDVLQAFADKNVVLLKADWTDKDPVITQMLESYGRSGVPLYVLYAPGQDQPEILPAVLTKQIVLEALAKL